jgi:translation initiation factor IF-1
MKEITGQVIEVLPQALYRVRCDEGDEVLASLGGRARQVLVRVIPGDRVRIERSPRDPQRGRITAKL